jgi:hypothetical protein
MEKPPYTFQGITHFSTQVERYGPRFDGVKTLTMEIGSNIPPGRYSLVLIKPFPPLGRPGEELYVLASLRSGDIDSIWTFRKADDGQWARVEIRGKSHRPTIFVGCERIEGVPGWDEKQIALDKTSSSGK